MIKYIYILIFSIAFSNGYNYIVNNKLDYSQDYTFSNLLERLPEYEETFITNCQNISDNLQEQVKTNYSLFVQSVNSTAGTSNYYYWVQSSDLQLFKGIELD